MSDGHFQRDNHYVPSMSLKRFADSTGRVWMYRILVPDSRLPQWKPASTKGIAYHQHLYTRIVAGKESDEVERWLNREFETPAENSLFRATSGARLSRSDWRNLIRFLAAQDVRTPARLIEGLDRWRRQGPQLIEETLKSSVARLEHARRTGQRLPREHFPNSDYLPVRITTELIPDQEHGTVKAELLVGRGLWLFGIRHMLTQREEILQNHRWRLLRAPDDLPWFTSDKPVIRLNYHREQNYDFNGGWKSPGTEILFPLSPPYLMYTKIGERRSSIETAIPRSIAEQLRRFIAENAHRFIFSSTPDPVVPQLRPRTCDSAIFENEQEQWRKWHLDQAAAERELQGD